MVMKKGRIKAAASEKPHGTVEILRPGSGLRSAGVPPALFCSVICDKLEINPANGFSLLERASAPGGTALFSNRHLAIRNARKLQKTNGGDHF